MHVNIECVVFTNTLNVTKVYRSINISNMKSLFPIIIPVDGNDTVELKRTSCGYDEIASGSRRQHPLSELDSNLNESLSSLASPGCNEGEIK